MGAVWGTFYAGFPLFIAYLHIATAYFVYPGNKYNNSGSTGSDCQYPAEATPSQTCPALPQTFSFTGISPFNLSDFNDNPPIVYTAVSMVQFGGIDQTLLTFRMAMQIDMIWEDSRGYNQIQRATEAALKSGKCSRYCSKDTQVGGTGYCCDGMWLPTLKFENGQPRTFSEEDYQIVSILPSEQNPNDGKNFTQYAVLISAAFDQPLDFSAFPFDRHALNARILCADCLMKRQTDIGGPYSSNFATSSIVSQQDLKGTNVDGQAVPPSAGWQLNSVDLAIINATTDYSDIRPQQRRLSSIREARNNPEYYGIIFILRVERVTRLFYTLQTIVPPIILTLIGFMCFLISQTNFTDRLKTLISVLFPTFVAQFTITNTLPKTSTLLSPQYLVFISIIELALLIAVAGVTSLILNRQTNFAWSQTMAKGRRDWARQRALDAKTPTIRQVDEEDPGNPKLVPKEAANCNGTAELPKPEEGSEEKPVAPEKRHDVQVEEQLAKVKSWPRPFRRVSSWWLKLAMSDAEGYREHVALMWELSALVFCFVLYTIAVLAIFLHLNELGKDPSTF